METPICEPPAQDERSIAPAASVTITSPHQGDTVTNPVTLTADCFGPTGSTVQVFVNGVQQPGPFSCPLSTSLTLPARMNTIMVAVVQGMTALASDQVTVTLAMIVRVQVSSDEVE
jgi:hypothetical protein